MFANVTVIINNANNQIKEITKLTGLFNKADQTYKSTQTEVDPAKKASFGIEYGRLKGDYEKEEKKVKESVRKFEVSNNDMTLVSCNVNTC